MSVGKTKDVLVAIFKIRLIYSRVSTAARRVVDGLDGRGRVHVIPVADLDEGGLDGKPEVEEEEGGDKNDARGDSPHDGRHEEEPDCDGDARQHGDDKGDHLQETR